jgi:hypothetical protein
MPNIYLYHRDPAEEWGSASDSDETDTPAAAAAATKKVQHITADHADIHVPISDRPPRRQPKWT